MIEDLFDKRLQKELQNITYPRQVDVVERVMEQVTKQQPLRAKWSRKRLNVAVGAAAASVAMVVVLGMTVMQKKQSVEENASMLINSVTAYVDDYFAESANEAESHFGYIEDFVAANEGDVD